MHPPPPTGSQRAIVVGTGIIPNRKGHPLIQRWYGVRFLAGKLAAILNLEQVLARTRFSGNHPNGVESKRPIHELRKEVGSLIADEHGIYAASRFMRHADIRITAASYLDKKKRIVAPI